MTLSGIGYDVHQFASPNAERPLILGGVILPSERGLQGHSDADVLSHAIADAILGALGLPDIGHYFPPTDPNWKDMCSLDILKKCQELAAKEEAQIIHVDSTIIAEEPKILPYREQMKEVLSGVLGLPLKRVNIKATTNEQMGFVGRKEGIAALSCATVLVSEI